MSVITAETFTAEVASNAFADIYNTRDLNTNDVYYFVDMNPYEERGTYYVRERQPSRFAKNVNNLRPMARGVAPEHIARVRHR